MIAIPIWLSMVWLRDEVKTSGARTKTRAYKLQTRKRPTFSGLKA